MSAYGLNPTFTTAAEYRAWRITWIGIHRDLLRRTRAAIAAGRPADIVDDMRVMAMKSRGLRQNAHERMARIEAMHEQMRAQSEIFPLEMPNCPAIDFHFNRASVEYDFLPPWVLKTKGKTFYVKDVVSLVGFDTKHRPEHVSTKGFLRIRRGTIYINEEGVASISATSNE